MYNFYQIRYNICYTFGEYMNKRDFIGKILLTIMFLFGFLLGIMFLNIYPYKEVCNCSPSECSVVKYYINYKNDRLNIPKSNIRLTKFIGGGRYRGTTYGIEPVIETAYMTKFRAESDYKKMISTSEACIVKWDILTIFLILFNMLSIILIINNIYKDLKVNRFKIK